MRSPRLSPRLSPRTSPWSSPRLSPWTSYYMINDWPQVFFRCMQLRVKLKGRVIMFHPSIY